jgi:ribonuclease P protein component
MADTTHAATASVQEPALDPSLKLDHLRTRADFQRLTRSRRKHATRGLVLQVAPQPEGRDNPQPRIGFTASKKVGNAVARNRAKRRLRALAREVLQPRVQPSLDYVLVGRHTTVTRPWSKLVQDLETAINRTQLDPEQS